MSMERDRIEYLAADRESLGRMKREQLEQLEPPERAVVREMAQMYQSRTFGILFRQYELEVRRVEKWASSVPVDAPNYALECAKRQGWLQGAQEFQRMLQRLPDAMRKGPIPAEENGDGTS